MLMSGDGAPTVQKLGDPAAVAELAGLEGDGVEVRLALCLVEASLKWSLQFSDGGGKRGGEGRQRLLLPEDPEK